MTQQDSNAFTPYWSRKVASGGTAWYIGGVSAPFSLAYGNPEPSLFPASELDAAAQRVLADPEASGIGLQYGGVQGQPGFLDFIAAKLDQEEGIQAGRENLVITNGASAAIGLAARALLDEGDVVLVEAPSFPGALSILRRTGATLRTMPTGPDGIDVERTDNLIKALLAEGAKPRIIYTIPTFQNPTGLTLPEASRRALLDLARTYNLTIIEDDAYRELYYDRQNGSLPPTFYSLDTEGRVIRTGTFSKILAPGMRLGYAVAQPRVIQRMLLLKDEGGTSAFAQSVALEYARNDELQSHIRGLIAAYRMKRDIMLDALDRHFPSEAAWTRPAGGFFVWVALPPTVNSTELARRALEQGVEYLPGEACFAMPPEPGTYLRLAYSLLPAPEIEEAVERLAGVIRTLL